MKNINYSYIISLLNKYDLEDPNIMGTYGLLIILSCFQEVLDNNIRGDVVELGCYNGGTSLFLRKMIEDYKSDKAFHVYDSWEGLAGKAKQDGNGCVLNGDCKGEKDVFIDRFKKYDIEIPVMHKGWFKDFPDTDYPDEISFAFFDGDFYQSIMDSFEKVYDKVVSGGMIVVHDFGQSQLEGVEVACNEFLSNKPEIIAHGSVNTPNGKKFPNVGVINKI